MKRSYEQILSACGVLYITVVGVSMLPLLRQGRDVIEIRPLEGPPSRYDAVLFRRPGVEGRGSFVFHRVIKVLPGDKYWVVGDNEVKGEVVEGRHILGRMTGFRRNGRDMTTASPLYRIYLALWGRPYRLRFAVLRMKRFAGRSAASLLRRIKEVNGRRIPRR